jgi:hypothetical protein
MTKGDLTFKTRASVYLEDGVVSLTIEAPAELESPDGDMLVIVEGDETRSVLVIPGGDDLEVVFQRASATDRDLVEFAAKAKA